MKIGLVLEGGAMRGLFTAGVLDIFLDNKRGSEAENFIFFYQLEKIKADNSKQLKVEISNSMGIFHIY